MKLEPAEIRKKKSPKTNSILLIRDFPSELMEKCKCLSGEVCGTNAVLKSLEKLFDYYDRFRELETRADYLESDLEEARNILADEAALFARKEKFLAQDINRFRLVGGL